MVFATGDFDGYGLVNSRTAKRRTGVIVFHLYITVLIIVFPKKAIVYFEFVTYISKFMYLHTVMYKYTTKINESRKNNLYFETKGVTRRSNCVL